MRKIKKGQIPIFSLFLLCCLIAVQPIVLSSPGYVTIGENVKFKASSSEGPLLFSSSVQATQVVFSGEYVQFSNLAFVGGSYRWSSLGFSCSNNASMTLSALAQKSMTLVVDAATGVKSITKIALPDTNYPSRIDGADSWSYSGNILTIQKTHSSSATFTFVWSPSVFPSQTDTGFIGDISSDFIGGLVGIYTDVMGPIFWVFISFILMVPLVNRIGILPIVVILGLVWGTLVFVLPAEGLNIIYAILWIGGASALVVLFFARRRQYG